MQKLNLLLNSLEHAITHQQGARKAFSTLKAFLLDTIEDVAEVPPPSTQEIEAGGAQDAPLGAPDGADTEHTIPD